MDAINWHSFFFLLFALVACVFAVAVVVSANIVRMAFYLVVSLGGVAGLFFLAGADFVAAVQMMIYVGGTMVLLAFGVMLTAQGPFVTMKIPRGQSILAVILGCSLLAVLVWAALSFGVGAATDRGTASVEFRPTATRLGIGLLGIRVDQQDQPDETLRKGMSGYLLAFEIVSVHLLVVLIGAAYLARARRRVAGRGLPEEPELQIEN
ncbi:MAG: NADH-quinone oxidoreductase subunit J [Planctomycetota bacterium]